MRLLKCLAALVAFSGASFGYYHFVHFPVRGSSVPRFEKFDLGVLPNRTVSYFVAEQSNIQFASGDSFASLTSHIRAAARVWNEVEGSELKLAFGGMVPPGTVQTAASIDVIFDEVAPGIVATGTPTVRADYNGAFIPITKSVIIVGSNLTSRPTHSEAFFGTMVHEFGHALGLQHSLASSAMATGITRATSKARPLTPDDAAGLSLLYPAPGFAAATGVIAGRVTQGGRGVNLASVVAISPNGPAVSALTNPDGTYRIEGLTQRSYLVYAHPLPPPLRSEAFPANIIPPVDADDRPLPASGPFETIFYPSTKEPSLAQPVQVTAGSVRDGVDFAVAGRGPAALHSVETFAFPGNSAVKPPYLSVASQRQFLVAGGLGLVGNSGPAAGLQVRVIGGPALAARPYPSAPASFLQLDVDTRATAGSGEGPRHLVFSTPNDIYVLPYAFIQVDRVPPQITGLTPLPDRSVILTGSGFDAATRILFDGVPGVIRSVDELLGRMLVQPPAAPANHKAQVIATNGDGQSSLFVQDPFLYTYDPADVATAALLSPAALPVGTEGLIQIDVPGAAFVDGQTSVGFGNADVVVRRLWVVSPTRLLLNVAVNPSAVPSAGMVTIVAGLQQFTQPAAFQVTPANSRSFSVSGAVMNAQTGLSVIYPGAMATFNVVSSPAALSALPVVATLNERPLQIVNIAGSQITVAIPMGTPPGPAIVRFDVGSERGLPVAVHIDSAPPVIVAALAAGNVFVDQAHPVRPGDQVTLIVTGLTDSGIHLASSRVAINVGGTEVPVNQIFAQINLHQVLFTVPAGITAASPVPVTLSIDGRLSLPFALHIAPR